MNKPDNTPSPDQNSARSGTRRKKIVPISWKLLGATAVVGAVAAVIAIIGLRKIQTLNRNLNETIDLLTDREKLVSLADHDLQTMLQAERILVIQSGDGKKVAAARVDEAFDGLCRNLSKLEDRVDPTEKGKLKQLSELLTAWHENHFRVRELSLKESELAAQMISFGMGREAIDRLGRALQAVDRPYQLALDSEGIAADPSRAADAARKRILVSAVSLAAVEMQRAEKNFLLAAPEERFPYEEEMIQLRRRVETRIDRLSEAVGGDAVADGDAIVQLRHALADYDAAIERIRSIANKQRESPALLRMTDVGLPLADRCREILGDLAETTKREVNERRETSRRTFVEGRNSLLLISVLGILFSVAIAFSTGHGVASRLGTLNRFAKSIHGTSDLSRPAPRLGNDEVGMLAESFDQMRRSLHEQTANLRGRTAELAKLSRTLEAKNAEMEQFVYTVSHDLKSPLVSCKGLLGFLREDVVNRDYEAIVESTGRLEQATEQLNQILEDLLMLSRIGRKSLNLEEVDVRGLINELVDEFAERIEQRDARIDFASPLPEVVADRSDARRVFENLLTNALKYGRGEEPPRIEVGSSSDSREVRYFVRDNGPGIDPRYHRKIFGLFQRLGTDQPGTGLGLASVAKIMNMHGGRAWVESDVGKGATFWVAFPRRPTSWTEEPSSKDPEDDGG